MDMSHAATCIATLRKVKDISTFLATRNPTFCCPLQVAKLGVTREIFLSTCLATNVARQVARKIASCNMALVQPRPDNKFLCKLARIAGGIICAKTKFLRQIRQDEEQTIPASTQGNL